MKKGFTMIELIFVIVILGILAAVAIPRLAATRDDAEVSKSLSNLATVVSDITANYTAQGGFNSTEISDYTNVQGVTYAGSDTLNALATTSGAKTVSLNYNVAGAPCALINLIKNAEEEVTLYIGTTKLTTLQQAIVTAEAELKTAQGTDIEGDTDGAKKTKAVEDAQKKVDAAKQALETAKSTKGGIAPDNANNACKSLTSAGPFKEMVGKGYRISGSRVVF